MKRNTTTKGRRARALVAFAGFLALAAGAETAADRDAGLLVLRVLPDSPAEKAGLLRGDILLSVDDRKTDTLSDLRGILAEKKAGQEVKLSVLRGESQKSLVAKLEERLYRPALGIAALPGGEAPIGALAGPDGAAGPRRLPEGAWNAPGLGQDGISPRDRIMEALPFVKAAALIAEVAQDSPAEKAGIVSGDRIVAVDDSELSANRGLAEAIQGRKPGEKLLLRVIDEKGKEREVDLILGESSEREGAAYIGVRYTLVPAFDRLRLRFDRENQENQGNRGKGEGEKKGKRGNADSTAPTT